MRFFCLFFLFLSFWPWEKDVGQIKKTSQEIPTDPALLNTVRVAIFYEKSSVSIRVPGSYEIQALPGHQALTSGSSLGSSVIRTDSSGIRLGSASYPVSGLRISTQNKEVQIENRGYHNVVEVLKNPLGSLTVINEIQLEDYLKGVLPSEMNATWSEEALKAQAVISRTYAIFKNIENQEFPFTLGSDVGTQVYGGKSVERSSANLAVEKTRGQILMYQGKIFSTFFHSTCGGRTGRADYQWNVQAHPSLKGVECQFCGASPYYFWKADFSEPEIRRHLSKKGVHVSKIHKISLDQPDDSGRPHFFVIQHDGGSVKMLANDFRIALGADRMRSTKVQINQQGETFSFKGQGWGHGVGLCQYGAKNLAELGYRYVDILRFYYPDSEVRNLNEFGLSGGPSLVTQEGNPAGRGVAGWFHKVKSYIEDL